jgi:16S rRNA (cytosine967-C5)-methyltransferase
VKPRNERARAAQFVAHISQDPNRTIDWYLANKNLSALESELMHGVLRHYFSLSHQVDAHLQTPLRGKDLDIYCLMLVGAYQLRELRIPAHAAVNETVQAVTALRKAWARGLVNAVMRKLSGQPPPAPTEQSLEAPPWLAEMVVHQYPNGPEILRALAERPPMCLRVNALRATPEQYAAELGGACEALWHPETILLEEPRPQETLPGYADGCVSVQDAAGQWAAYLLDIPQGGSLLDACAAPGGKLFHALERHPTVHATALELNERRAKVLEAQAKRLGHTERMTLLIADASTPAWWLGSPYDAVLLDAPCSGTGTLRRNPDIKLHRSPKDVDLHAGLQKRLLANLWPMLKPGGSLLYCTCSILQQENDDIIELFLNGASDARPVALHLPVGQKTRHGWQLLPTDMRTDGFYYAKLEKAAPTGPGAP